jgi:hypothetical protein
MKMSHPFNGKPLTRTITIAMSLTLAFGSLAVLSDCFRTKFFQACFRSVILEAERENFKVKL